MEVDIFFPCAGSDSFEPFPLRAADASVFKPDIVQILDLDPGAGFEQGSDGVAHIVCPFCHTADEQAADNVVEAGARLHLALEVGDVARGWWIGGARELRDGGEIEAGDCGGGWVRGTEVVGHGAGAAADRRRCGLVRGA